MLLVALANTRPGLYATRESAHLGAARERPVKRGEALEEVRVLGPSVAERRDRHRRHLESVECTSGVMQWCMGNKLGLTAEAHAHALNDVVRMCDGCRVDVLM